VTGATGTLQVPWAATVAEMGLNANIEPTVPHGLYSDHAALGVDDPLTVDPAAASELLNWFRRGGDGLRLFAPSADAVLWPEHFDLAITVDEVNFGLSLGDAAHPAPYAYVGPWQPRSGPFWNAPFGASRPAVDLADAEATRAFFAEGARRAAADPLTRS